MFARYQNVLLVIVRLVVGGIFIMAGWVKVADMATTVGYFSQMGLPAAIAYIVAYAEILGGAAVVLGFLTEIASIGLGIIMLGALYFGYKMAPLMGISVFQAIMPNLAVLASLIALIGSGAGTFAIPLRKRHR